MKTPKRKKQATVKALGAIESHNAIPGAERLRFHKRKTTTYEDMFLIHINGESRLTINGSFNRDEIPALIAHLNAWVATGSLELR